MITPELPPLRPFYAYQGNGYTGKDYCDTGPYVTVEEVEARERIFLARVAELERLWQSAEACYAEADAAAMSHAKRIAELEAERWPYKPTPAMRDALRTGSRRDYPSDELCDVRYAALLAARCAK